MYIERRFKFPDEQHFVNKTVKFAAALLKHVKLADLSMYKVTPLMQNFLLNFYCFLLYFILILIHIFYCTLVPIVYLSYIYLLYSYSF